MNSLHPNFVSAPVRHRPRPRPWGWLGCLIFVVISGFAAAAPQTNAPAGTDYASFKLISEKNIFNPNRSRGRRGEGDQAPAPRVDTITLYGTFIYEKGLFAFFTGSSSEYNQVLNTGKSIAGYTITEVTGTGVKLAAGTNTVELRVGMQLRREEGGDWQAAGGSAGPASVNGSSIAAADASSDDSDIVKRLIKQREQDLK
jgi:hypothetical protein